MERDALHERVPCLASGGVVNIAPQIFPWTRQDHTPWLPCFFQEEVGVELKIWLATCSTALFALGWASVALSTALERAESYLTSPSDKYSIALKLHAFMFWSHKTAQTPTRSKWSFYGTKSSTYSATCTCLQITYCIYMQIIIVKFCTNKMTTFTTSTNILHTTEVVSPTPVRPIRSVNVWANHTYVWLRTDSF